MDLSAHMWNTWHMASDIPSLHWRVNIWRKRFYFVLMVLTHPIPPLVGSLDEKAFLRTDSLASKVKATLEQAELNLKGWHGAWLREREACPGCCMSVISIIQMLHCLGLEMHHFGVAFLSLIFCNLSRGIEIKPWTKACLHYKHTSVLNE